jgi:hypothetical protein
MTKTTEVTFETQMSPNGADIGIPKQALEALGLPSEYDGIQGQGVYVNLSVFRTRDDLHLGTRDRLLLYPARRVYWAHGEQVKHPGEEVRIHLRRGERR